MAAISASLFLFHHNENMLWHESAISSDGALQELQTTFSMWDLFVRKQERLGRKLDGWREGKQWKIRSQRIMFSYSDNVKYSRLKAVNPWGLSQLVTEQIINYLLLILLLPTAQISTVKCCLNNLLMSTGKSFVRNITVLHQVGPCSTAKSSTTIEMTEWKCAPATEAPPRCCCWTRGWGRRVTPQHLASTAGRWSQGAVNHLNPLRSVNGYYVDFALPSEAFCTLHLKSHLLR